MIFDSHGLPKDTGASDYMDSCRMAGLMVIFDHPQAPDMRMYLVNGEGVRHPFEFPSNNPKNFTRDQLMCLAAALHKQGRIAECRALYEAAKARGNRAQNTEADVPGSTKQFPNGADWLSPSHMNHLRICAGLKPTLLGKAWLMVDIAYSSWATPLQEPNQLMCMCKVAGSFYVSMFKKLNSKLKEAIEEYWTGWREEDAFSDLIIQNF